MNALAWALLDFVWQGALVGCAAAVLLALMGRARPQARYAVACAALLLCALLPLAGVLAYLDSGAGAMPASAWPGAARAGNAAALALDAGLAANAGPGPGLSAQGWQDALQLQLRPRLPLVILCWAIGAAVLACRLLLGLAWVRRRSRPGAYRCDPAWQAVLDRLAVRLGIGRRVVLGLVDDAGAALAGPVTAGWWRPLVLVPAALATGMAPHLLEALLAHELAHVRRHDYLVNLMQSAIEVLLFYHPAVWWLSHRIRVERELVADDLAASMLGEPRRLALALSELDLFQLSTHHLAPAAHGGNLMSRIKHLVRPQSEPINWKLALPLLGLALSAAVVAGTAQAERQAEPVQQARQQAADAGRQAQAAATQAAVQADAASRQAERAASRAARAAARGERTQIHHVSEGGYALVQGDKDVMKVSGDGSDTGTLRELHKGIDGEFLWFRDGGKSWVVQDPAVLAKAHAAYAPMERLGEQMNAYGKQMDQHGKAMDALGKDMSRAAAGMQPDQARLQALQTKMNGLGRQMGKLGGQMGTANDDERRRLDGEMRRLSAQMSELGAQMGEAGNPPEQRAAKESMDEIGRRMNEAGKPMDALGKQMNVLGKQMEEEGKTADKTMRALIRDAQARGLARQVPQG